MGIESWWNNRQMNKKAEEVMSEDERAMSNLRTHEIKSDDEIIAMKESGAIEKLHGMRSRDEISGERSMNPASEPKISRDESKL
jgi:hypothetical protein